MAAEIRKRRMPIFSYPHFSRPGRAFTQPDAIYHQCGATPLLVEFPTRTEGNPLTFDQVLDVGLMVFETILCFGREFGFHPCLRKHLVDGRVVTRYGKIADL